MRLSDFGPDDRVIEVGAGLGALTLGLAEVAASVIAIEFDRKLVAALEETLHETANVSVISGDAMAMDLEELTAGRPHTFASNLPYNISTPLLAKLLEAAPSIVRFVVMVQKEAGQRLLAGPGTKSYGSISVRVRYHCDARMLGSIPRSVFWPVPKVDSVLICLTRRKLSTQTISSTDLMRVVRAAFAERRKTARNSLVSSLGLPPQVVDDALALTGIDPSARAESLDLDSFAALAQRLP